MPAVYAKAPLIGKPTPPWQQREHETKVRARRAPDLPIVTTHTPPWREVLLSELPSAATLFVKAATAAGLEVAARAAGDRAVQVGVRERDRNALWMRATWHRTPAGRWTPDGVHVTTVDAKLGVVEAKRMLADG